MKQINFLKDSRIQRVLLLLAVFILLYFVFKGCGRTNIDDDVTQLEQNVSYYKDSLRIEKNKNGDLEYKRAVLAATNSTLQELNADLKIEVEKQTGNVVFLQKTVFGLNRAIDSLKNGMAGSTVNVTVNKDNTQTINFTYDKIFCEGNERHLEGNVIVDFCKDKFITQTFITTTGDTVNLKIPIIDKDKVVISLPKDSMIITIITGLEQNKKTGLLDIYVRSEYPGFVPYKIDGAIIDPQKSDLIKSYFPEKKWGVGFGIGAGALVAMDGTVKVGPVITLGVSYDIWSFNPKKIFKK